MREEETRRRILISDWPRLHRNPLHTHAVSPYRSNECRRGSDPEAKISYPQERKSSAYQGDSSRDV